MISKAITELLIVFKVGMINPAVFPVPVGAISKVDSGLLDLMILFLPIFPKTIIYIGIALVKSTSTFQCIYIIYMLILCDYFTYVYY